MRAARTRNSSSSCRMPKSCWRIPPSWRRSTVLPRRICSMACAARTEPNKPGDVTWSIELLQTAQQAGRKVLVVEYLKDPEKMTAAAERTREEGFVPYFAPRQLQCLNPPAVLSESGSLPEHPCR